MTGRDGTCTEGKLMEKKNEKAKQRRHRASQTNALEPNEQRCNRGTNEAQRAQARVNYQHRGSSGCRTVQHPIGACTDAKVFQASFLSTLDESQRSHMDQSPVPKRH